MNILLAVILLLVLQSSSRLHFSLLIAFLRVPYLGWFISNVKKMGGETQLREYEAKEKPSLLNSIGKFFNRFVDIDQLLKTDGPLSPMVHSTRYVTPKRASPKSLQKTLSPHRAVSSQKETSCTL